MTGGTKPVFFDWLTLWISLSAWATLSGWCLSLLGCLTAAGTLVSLLLFLVLIIFGRAQFLVEDRPCYTKFWRHHWMPKLWATLAILALIGGLVYSPNNYDYLTYRLARVLHWTWDHAWYWIPTDNTRMNYSAPGFEWLMTPLLILFKTDRLFFLINFISYLFLPRLVFSVFTGLGISKRISYAWMWLLPCGYCYILQAASAGNDSFAAVYLLASLHYLLRANDSSAVKCLIFSAVSIALATGAKASNLPLVLPWLTVLFLHRSLFWTRGRSLVLIPACVVVIAVSFIPMAVLNIHFTGDYSGDPGNEGKMKLSNPVAAVVGNSLQLAVGNLTPPVLPRAIDWKPLLPSGPREKLLRDFPRLDLTSGELQIEEDAGFGLGLTGLLILFVSVGIWAHAARPSLVRTYQRPALWLAGASMAALGAYMAKMGSESTSRLIAAYYPLLLAAVLSVASLDGQVIRHRLFQWTSFLAMLSVLPLIFLSPARPLFPVSLVATTLARSHVPAGIITRFNLVYSVYSHRADPYRELTASIPPDEHVIGLYGWADGPESPLWRPFGTREVITFAPSVSADEVRATGVHFVVVDGFAMANPDPAKVAQIAQKWAAVQVQKAVITTKAQVGPHMWFLLRL
jgi:hypothetical protein